ncbi:MAG: hypothetical protein FWD63_07225, partial [Propionibacteriaceae bacterium]|nr:hypothetical protein [Propionibacteriaceae bacterium]
MAGSATGQIMFTRKGVSVVTRQLTRAGLVGAVLCLAIVLAGCAPSAPPTPTPTPGLTPTASGGTGPFGVVQVNQTFTGRAGVTITIQEATKWLPPTQYWSKSHSWARIAGLRVIVDDRQAKAAGTKLDDWPP